MLELSAAAREHFEHPRNVGALNLDSPDVAAALVGEPVSGAILQLHLRVDAEGIITAARFKAYGCGWTVACGSLLTECLRAERWRKPRASGITCWSKNSTCRRRSSIAPCWLKPRLRRRCALMR